MQREEYIAQFQSECYLPAASAAMNRFMASYADHSEEIHKTVIGQFDAFSRCIVRLQERQLMDSVHSIAISFPYSSLLCGNPCMMFELYPDFPFFAPHQLQEIFSAPWVFPEWDTFYEDLLGRTQKLGLGTVIRPPYIKSSLWDVARYILHFVSTFVKTQLVDVERLSSFCAMRKAETFRITFGEYMDWQRLIYAQLPSIDIFNCEEDETLSFRVFCSAVYEDKVFANLTLDDARFESCIFRNCLFKGTKLRDAKFEGCDFENCRFEQVRLDGARFSGSKLQNVEMSEVKTNCMIPDPDTILGGFTTTDFINCFLENVSITQSDYSASQFQGCQVKNLTSDTSELSNSLELLLAQG
ncbi:hypothetical protein D7V91_11970 [bacterium 1xD42-67]|nr:hypothetical protein D7V91_11970 [bacterium 1xD42-67]